MSNIAKNQNRPQRTLIAYCTLAERLSSPNANMVQALVPFFTEACREFAGKMFDPVQFSTAIKNHYSRKKIRGDKTGRSRTNVFLLLP